MYSYKVSKHFDQNLQVYKGQNMPDALDNMEKMLNEMKETMNQMKK